MTGYAPYQTKFMRLVVTTNEPTTPVATAFSVDGAQIEASQSYATPYVDTNGAAATRTAPLVQTTTALGLNSTQGWIAARVQVAASGATGTVFALDDGTSNNVIGLTASWQWLTQRTIGGSSGNAIGVGDTFAAGDTRTVILRWDASTIGVSLDGGSFVSIGNAGGSFTPTTLQIGSLAGAGQPDLNFLWLTGGTGALSNADAAAIYALGPAAPSLAATYDGTYALTATATDDDGQATTSAATPSTVANTAGTKYQVGYSSTAIPGEMTYDPTLGTQTSWPITVTLTNNASTTLLASQTALRYTWVSADDVPVVTAGANVALTGDIAPGAHGTVTVNVTPPALPANVERANYTLQIDLVDTSANRTFSSMGDRPLQQSVVVNLATPLELGLERFQEYDGADLGDGFSNAVNLANGNNVISWTPFDEPGVGLDTVVGITYNSGEDGSRSPLGNNVSLTISGLTPLGNPLDIHPNASDTAAGRTTPWIGFVDGDGSYHVFTGQTASDGTVYWTAPAGVHLYLRQYSTTDPTHWWALTKPDQTTFFFDQNGYPTAVSDGNGNTIAFTETPVAAGNDANGLTEQVTQVTDQGITPGGGRSFNLTYYSQASTPIAALRGKVQTISDHLGDTLAFSYYNDGNLMRITQTGGVNPDGSWQPSRSIVLDYTAPGLAAPAVASASARLAPDPATVQSTKLYALVDYRGDATTFGYISAAGPTQGRLASRTDRSGATTSYSYNTATATATVSEPLSRVWSYAFDSQGRVTSITDPVDAQPELVTWTADNEVSRIVEPSGRQTDYAYNQNGYLTDSWDETGAHTVLAYQSLAVDANDVSGKWEAGRTIPHVSFLVAQTQPGGNLLANDGFETGTTGWSDGGTSSTTLTQDTTTALFGSAALKAAAVDSSHNPTVRTTPTGLGALVAGAVYTFTVWVDAPAGTSMNLAAYRADFSTSLGQTNFIATGTWQRVTVTFTAVASEQGYVYVRSTSAFNGGTFWIDAASVTATTSPTGAAFPYTTQFDYDAHGNPLHVADPLGNLTTLTYNTNGTLATQTSPNNGDGIVRTTTYNSYDANGLATQVTDAAGGITRAGYDAAGNVLWLQDPDHATYAGGVTANYRTQYVYDRFGRLVRTSTPKSTQFTPGLLTWTDTVYDANDNVVSDMNAHFGVGDSQGAPVTTTVYDAMDRPTLVTSPDTVGGSKQTQTVYDAAGRTVLVTDPKGVATTTVANDYATATTYDLLDRVASTTEYYADSNGNLNPALNETTYSCYDAAGDLRSVTGPDGAASFTGCPAATAPSAYVYTTAPDTTTYAYDAAHRQTRAVDAVGDTTASVYDEDGNLVSSTDANGNITTYGYDARGEQTKVVAPFDPTTGHNATTINQYDALGNLSATISPRAYDASTDKQTFANYVTSYSYDALNRLIRTSLPTGPTTTYDSAVMASSGGAPLNYWKFDGNGNDSMPAANNLTSTGGNYTCQTPILTSLGCYQATSNAKASTSASFGTYKGQFSLELWVEPTTQDETNGVYIASNNVNNGDSGWLLKFWGGTGAGIFFQQGLGYSTETQVRTSTTLSVGTWHQVVVTEDATCKSFHIYIDGAEASYATYKMYGCAPTPTLPVSFGAATGGSDTISYDNAAWYTYQLTAADVSAHFQAELTSSSAPAYLHTAYDPDGNVVWTSQPTAQACATGNVLWTSKDCATSIAASDIALNQPSDMTQNQYWDSGAVYSTAAPNVAEVRYDYTATGWESARSSETANGSGVIDYSHQQLWTYFADGKLLSQTDQAGLRDTYTYDANGNETSVTEALGAGNSSTALPVTVTASYDGLDQLTKVRIPELQSAGYDRAVLSSSGGAPLDYWKFDGNGNDSMAAGNTLNTSAGNFTCSPGITGSTCYQAPANAKAYTTTSYATYTGQFSLELWVWSTAQDETNGVYIVSNNVSGGDSGWLLKFWGGTTNGIFFQQGLGYSTETQVRTTTTLSTNTWHLVVVTEDATCKNAHIYIDGSEAGYATNKAYGCAPAPTQAISFGAATGGSDDIYFDNAAWYAYQLTPADVSAHYHAATAAQSSYDWSTSFAYDLQGNTTQLVENQEETATGAVVTPGRTETYTYNYIDQATSQVDDFGTPTNTADDEQFTFGYTPTGLLAGKTTAKSNGAGGWINEQAFTETYYANGLPKTLLTTDGGSPATTIAQDTLSYVDANGVYMDGNKTSDTFLLQVPNGSPCYPTACTASWGYDARDRLVKENSGVGTTVGYLLDVYGNSQAESTVTAGSGSLLTRQATYAGLQLSQDTTYVASASTPTATSTKYFYDTETGNLLCTVTSAWAGTACPSITGTIDPSLLTYNVYDSKGRLINARAYASGTLTSSAVYTLDALDRILSESTTANGVTTHTDTTYIGLSPAVAQDQVYNGTGVLSETMKYVYDAVGERATLTDIPVGGTTARYSYVYDPHGSVEALVDQNRTVKASYGYSAYGSPITQLTNTAAGFNSNANLYRYDGDRYDLTTKTVDMGARVYAPKIERFIQRDAYFTALDDMHLSTNPIDGNRYALTGANPVNFVDRDGHGVGCVCMMTDSGAGNGGNGVTETTKVSHTSGPAPVLTYTYSSSSSTTTPLGQVTTTFSGTIVGGNGSITVGLNKKGALSVQGDGFSLSDSAFEVDAGKLFYGDMSSVFGNHVGISKSEPLSSHSAVFTPTDGVSSTVKVGGVTFTYQTTINPTHDPFAPIAYTETLQATVKVPAGGTLTFSEEVNFEPVSRPKLPKIPVLYVGTGALVAIAYGVANALAGPVAGTGIRSLEPAGNH